ncbi:MULTISPECIES: AraC family transcriptional regulator [Bacillus cereus group]|uniref:AraC family transcriptional regulator n=1 Tax=Bacillus cereus group TaxID=86661 RepID=UPI000BEB4D87|nr:MULTISPECIES: AraC family transcriptional regulator [Bacillus cereus group]MBJ8073836.1 helix-turn-helix transcriptional regulator [Bacillus cereus group sp. N12]MBJ8097134.1 helix-turn-helix transcriptional regulator [Bacillus cereus group sp. N11]PDY86572.1 AraC family transcriptional regulator [Bacillus toyonensis]PGE62199.1 AraC family transcriptional regulator [Bacillus toyonensis]PHD38200.1 AraC family transcriptional regulator [Bacillus toyonensis]
MKVRQGKYEEIKLRDRIPGMVEYIDSTRLPADFHYYIPPHWHRSIEISLVIYGDVSLYVNGQKKKVSAGEFIFVNSGDVHEFEKVENASCAVMMLIVSYEFLKELNADFDKYRFTLQASFVQKEKLQQIFYELKELVTNFDELSYIKMNSLIYEIVYILLRHCKDRKKEDNDFQFGNKQKEIITYMYEYYDEKLKMKDVAKHFFVSEEHFSRMFKKSFGSNFTSFLTRYRLHKAYEDIISSTNSIQDIAVKHGFPNVKSFISQFKGKYGDTPLQYRKNIISKNDNN